MPHPAKLVNLTQLLLIRHCKFVIKRLRLIYTRPATSRKLLSPPFAKSEGVACDSETLEWQVVYKPIYEHKSMPDLWVRPYDMFVGTIEVEGATVKRFTYLDKEA